MNSTQTQFNGSQKTASPAAAQEALDLFGIARRRKWALIGGMAFGLFLALAYHFLTTPLYRADMQIMVMQKDASMPTRATQNASETEVGSEVLATHMEVFQSRRIIKDAIETHELDKIPSIAEQIALKEDPVEFIGDRLTVSIGGEGLAEDATVLVASYSDPSPEHCATILNSIHDCYQRFLGKTFQTTSDEAVALITTTRHEMEAELIDIENRYRKFREEVPLIWDGTKLTNLHQMRQLEIQSDMSENRNKMSLAKSRLATIADFIATRSESQITDFDRLALLGQHGSERMMLSTEMSRGDATSEEFQRNQALRAALSQAQVTDLLALKLKRETLLQQFGTDYPEVITVQNSIKAIEDFLTQKTPDDALNPGMKTMTPAEILRTGMETLKHDINDCQKIDAELEKQYTIESAEARRLSGEALRGETLEAELTRKRALYDEAVEKLGDMNLIRDYGGFVAEVISPAEPQTEKSWPQLPISVAGGCLFGFLMGTALALFLDFSDTTFRGPEQLEDAIGVPIAAHIPMIDLKRKELKGEHVDETLVTYHAPGSREAEAFRSLRTSLLFDTKKHNSKLIGFTSPTPGDGKTTTVANLAASAALSGKKVLVMDCDLRRPRVSSMYGLADREGMSELLLEGRELTDVMASVEGIDNLTVIPSGHQPPNPAELLMLPEFEQLLNVVREKFDYVILDLPPLLAVSDPAIVAPMLDGIVFTLRVVKNGTKSAMKARKILDDLEVRIIAAVVNASSGAARSYGYADTDKYEYQYGYSYGYGRTNQQYFARTEPAPDTRL